MSPFKRVIMTSYEARFHFHDGEFRGQLSTRQHWLLDPLGNVQVGVACLSTSWLAHGKLEVIAKSRVPAGRAEIVDLKDCQYALAWIDGRFSHILPSGLYTYWTGVCNVRVEVIDARTVRLQYAAFEPILRSVHAAQVLDICTVDRNHMGVSLKVAITSRRFHPVNTHFGSTSLHLKW